MTGLNLTLIRNHEFHKMDALKKLILNDMPNLEAVEPLAFHGLHDMEVIELKNNPKLSYIDRLAFYDSMVSEEPNLIANLDLSNNNLKTLPETLLDWDQVESVNLNGNPWSCDCNLAWIVDSGLYLSEFLTCSSPSSYANALIKTLNSEDFICPESLLQRAINIVMGAAITVFLLLFAVAIFVILKPNFTLEDLLRYNQ